MSTSNKKQDPKAAKNPEVKKEAANKNAKYVNPALAWCLLGGTLALAIIIGLIVLL